MSHDAEAERLFEISNQLQARSKILTEKAQIQSDIFQALDLCHQKIRAKIESDNREIAEQQQACREWLESSRRIQLLRLFPEEMELAQKVWRDLRNGVPNAPKRLKQLPIQIQSAILEALLVAIDNGEAAAELS